LSLDFSASLLRFIGLVERLLIITREQHRQLLELDLVAGKTVDKLVHEAVKRYFTGFGMPNPDNKRLELTRYARRLRVALGCCVAVRVPACLACDRAQLNRHPLGSGISLHMRFAASIQL